MGCGYTHQWIEIVEKCRNVHVETYAMHVICSFVNIKDHGMQLVDLVRS